MERDLSPPPPATFEQRYTGLREIGRGASSVVHRAWSPEFARDVAIKVFHGGVADADLRRRFRRECRSLGTLTDHPHVVSVFDSGFTATGQPYLVMAYCAGGSFGRRLAEHGPRPPAEVAAVGIALADALAAAHAHAIVHRDVKPHNVLLTAYGVVALADFGVAGGGGGGGIDLRSFAASPGYAAPEVVHGDGSGNPAGDLYALGATLYALLTGGPPHRQRPEEADVAYLIRAAATPPPPLGSSVPPALVAVVRDCLQPDPGARPADAGTVRQRLRAAAAEAGLDLPERIDVAPVPAGAGPDAATWLPAARNGSDGTPGAPGAPGPLDAAAAAAAAPPWAGTGPDAATWLPAAGLRHAATRTAPPGAPASWPRRLAVAGLGAGLVAAGVAGGALLLPASGGGDEPARTVPGPSVTVTARPEAGGPVEQIAEQPRRTKAEKRKAGKTPAAPADGPAERRKDNSGNGNPKPGEGNAGKGPGKTP